MVYFTSNRHPREWLWRINGGLNGARERLKDAEWKAFSRRITQVKEFKALGTGGAYNTDPLPREAPPGNNIPYATPEELAAMPDYVMHTNEPLPVETTWSEDEWEQELHRIMNNDE